MKQFRFPLTAPLCSISFWNERADKPNNPPVRPQFSGGRHDDVPLCARRTKNAGRRTAATSQCSIAQQRCRKRRLPGFSDLVVLARRTDLALRHAVVFPPRFDVTGILEAAEGGIDSATRETGDRDYIEAVLVALGDGFQYRRCGVRERARLHMTYSTYIALLVKARVVLKRGCVQRSKDCRRVTGQLSTSILSCARPRRREPVVLGLAIILRGPPARRNPFALFEAMHAGYSDPSAVSVASVPFAACYSCGSVTYSTQILPLALSCRTMSSSSTTHLKGVACVAEEGQNRRTPTTIEELSASMDRGFEAVDHRFEAADRRFEAVDRRFEAVDRRFDAVDRRFDAVDRQFEAVDRRFEAVDHRFEAVDHRFEAVDRRFDAVDAAIVEQRQYTEFAFGMLQQELVVVKSGLGRVERKLDRLIDGRHPSEKPEPE
jgi:hypothetical protein